MPPPPGPGILRRPAIQYYTEDPNVRVEVANKGRRRTSYYDQPETSTEQSEYFRRLQAITYQEDVGGPSMPLTADMLRRQQRRGAGSSRSTKDSAYGSATTRTTRSGVGDDDENVTIKIGPGTARVMVGGAQIDCVEGGEIEIKRQKILRPDSIQAQPGSDAEDEATNMDRIEDRRNRVERPTGRSRMSSTTDVQYPSTHGDIF